MKTIKRRWWLILVVGVLGFAPTMPRPSAAYSVTSLYFPQTNHAVSGAFLQYWQEHGGLAQQGYPLSEEIQERSDVDGRTYTVQYFERAVFEKHPENAAPYDVQLALLGAVAYQQRYGGGVPLQRANTTNGRYFPETNHWIGGAFRTYWEQHGGLSQQGLPLSEELQETIKVNGQPYTYTVQYFERAVFEWHPENAPPYDVLLSPLGAQRFAATYEASCVNCASDSAAIPNAQACYAGDDLRGSATPDSIPAGEAVAIRATGFQPRESITISTINPSATVITRGFQTGPGRNTADAQGVFSFNLQTAQSWASGRWSVDMTGDRGGNRSVVHFCVRPFSGSGFARSSSQ